MMLAFVEMASREDILATASALVEILVGEEHLGNIISKKCWAHEWIKRKEMLGAWNTVLKNLWGQSSLLESLKGD
jgi:hypothetical protein